ncbi:MAG: cytochrome-c peroxidase [Acidobacteria bacterium RIFCSPLOWO2_02_FULL_68_18]|nr:MAG: cytochrome-c peroxidase [Acidobacteria bacterium RIFCSPLOWO2_02_FULL_68_18]OFW50456.1 MAG: cytochrome-c peroxidase [Acidobacteria bacterium RIFCSPLOWO2_12_FULL_68_19]
MGRLIAGALLIGATCVALLSFTGEAGSQEIGTPLPRAARAPADNPTTPAKVSLGRLLFWDPMLSGPRDVACATCHHPQFGYAENRDLSIGVTGAGLGHRRRFSAGSAISPVKRNSQTILNVAFNGSDVTGQYDPAAAPMFWDVRARGLEAQALEPLKALEEMRGQTYAEDQAVQAVVARLEANAEYRRLFAAAFPGERAVTAATLGKALAAFQRTLTAANAPFDRYMRGEGEAMTASQLRGMRRFERVGCVRCHNGPMFSDYKLHVLGVPDNPALPASDTGAGERGTGERYAFRTASLRNLAFTAPYMHNGLFETLGDVLEFYDDVDSRRRSDRNPNVNREELDPLLRQLRGVDEDDEDLIAFLGALSDPAFDRTTPSRVPSGLPVGGRIQ